MGFNSAFKGLTMKRWFHKRTFTLKDSNYGKVQQGLIRTPNTVLGVRFTVRQYFGN